MFLQWLLLIGLGLLGSWVMGQTTRIDSDEFCMLQTHLEEGAALAMAKENAASIELLTEYLDSFPAQLDPATERLKAEYLYHVGYSAFYECLAAYDQQVHALCKNTLAEADSLIARIESKSSTLKARILRSRGQCAYFLEENPLEAQDFYESAYSIWLIATQKDSVELASVLQCMGQAATKQGEYERAINLYQQSLEIREEIFGHNHPRVGKAYWDLGNAYGYSDRYGESVKIYQIALDIIKMQNTVDEIMMANIMTNLAASYNELGDYEAAVKSMNAAIAIKRRIEPDNSTSLVNYYSILAVALANQKKFNEADQAISTIKDICAKNDFQDGEELAYLQFAEARVSIVKGVPADQSFAALQKALATLTQQDQLGDWRSFPELKSSTKPMLLQQIILDKSNFLSKLGRQNIVQQEYLLTSLEGYRLASQLSDQLRLHYKDQDDKLFLSGRGSIYLQDALACAFLLWEQNHDSRYANQAFQFMENCKFQLLLDFFRKSRIQGAHGISRLALARLDNLHRRCTELDFLLALPDVNSDSLKKYQNELFEKRIQESQLRDSLENSSRLFRTMYGRQSKIEIDSIQPLLPARTAMISYSISDSILYILGIQKQQVTFRKARLPEHFSDSLNLWVDLCREPIQELPEIETFSRIGHTLYQLLLEPEVSNNESIDQLLLVPDGLLGQLPFEALPTKAIPGLTSFANMPYLLHDYKTYYAASATLWRDQQILPIDGEPLSCLGIAWGSQGIDSIIGVQGKIRGLKGTEKELNTIKSIVQGDFYIGGDASEARFKTLAPQFDILHLALHARATETDPQILFPASGEGGEDGILHFHELFPLHLSSRLAVLSACETGRGRLIQGEGIQSMSSGFAAAGVPSVLMSLWEVDDDAGGQIMESFYEGIAEGLPIDASLQMAKLTYLESAAGLKAAPYYWSAFVPMGNMAPLKLAQPSRFNWWIIVGGSVALLCIFIAFRIYLKKRKSI